MRLLLSIFILLCIIVGVSCSLRVKVNVDVSNNDNHKGHGGLLWKGFEAANDRIESSPLIDEDYEINDPDHVDHETALRELNGDDEDNEDEEEELTVGGSSCKSKGVAGTCTSKCSNGVFVAGLCPGPTSVKCCIPHKAAPPAPKPSPSHPSCNVAGITGSCIPTGECKGITTPGHCPGASNIECCTSKSSELCGDKVLARAKEWVDAKLQYCQSAYGQRDYDSACSTYCRRQSNSAWNSYRSDCSGLASWSYGLAAPGLTTLGYAPFSKAVSYAIQASELRAGDAINNNDHIMLFKQWVTHGKEAEFYEEPGCSANPPHARLTTTAVSISGSSIHVTENGMTFTAIRRNGC